MSIGVWLPNTVYSPGAQVLRATVPPIETVGIPNASFDDGDTQWTKDANWSIEVPPSGNTFDGTYAARLRRTGPGAAQPVYERIVMLDAQPAVPGQEITASCRVNQGGASAGYAGAKVQIEWLDAALASLRIDDGNMVKSGSNGSWKLSTVTATAPADTAYVRVAASGYQKTSANLWVDAFTWNYTYRAPYTSFVYAAVQAADGVSGAVEPNWPSDPTTQVVDNTVIWQAVYGSSVTWEAVPILKTGATEPTWPTEIGSSVVDGSIVWTAASRRVTDPRCPNSKVVAIAASKIFAGNDDVVSYSATVDPLDWSTEEDAGYLPFGLQTHGANPVSGLGLYRGNLVAFNSAGFQMWQVDQDPVNMALLDAAPIGCTYSGSIQPLQNDLIFLSAVGVRNISIAGASTNLQAGSTGEPIDPLVLAKIRESEFEPVSKFFPAYGQYWLGFGEEVFVLTLNEGRTTKWSRYVFPEPITDITLLDNDLYLRTETHKVWKVSELNETLDDYVAETDTGVEFYGVVQWPHLDFGALGVTKQFVGFDLVANAPNGVSVSVGYDQRDLTFRTADYALDADTLPAQLVPIPVSAPSFDFKLTFEPDQSWEWFATVLYVTDRRPGS